MFNETEVMIGATLCLLAGFEFSIELLIIYTNLYFTDHEKISHTPLQTCFIWERPQSSEGDEL